MSKIIQFPNSLLSIIFKAKYFLTCDVFDATFKSNCSFAWKRTFCVIDLVRHGIRWRVGNGKDINVWNDNWLPRDYALRPFTPDLYQIRLIYVASLIDQNNGCWDVNVLNALLWNDDIDIILKIPLDSSTTSDFRILHYNRRALHSEVRLLLGKGDSL